MCLTIVYFSGTGNSRHTAEHLAHDLEDELVDAGAMIHRRQTADLTSSRPWVFVSPTYAWQIPHIFSGFLRSGRFQGSRDAYFVMTCGDGIGNAAKPLAGLCREVGFTFRGVFPLVMPENYIALFPVPDGATADRLVKVSDRHLEKAISCIRANQPLPPCKVTVRDRLKTGLANSLFYFSQVRTRQFTTKNSCTGCGRCVDACPLNNIQLEDDRPVWGENCTHCMACICGCPAEAIEYGRASRGKPRYQCPPYRPDAARENAENDREEQHE